MEQGADNSRFVRYGALGSCESFSGCSPSWLLTIKGRARQPVTPAFVVRHLRV